MIPVARQRSLLLVLNFAVSIDGFLPEGKFSFFLVSVSMRLAGVIPTISDNNSLPPTKNHSLIKTAKTSDDKIHYPIISTVRFGRFYRAIRKLNQK